MDDLREKLGRLHGVAWTQPTGEVTITFDPRTNDAQLAFDAVMAVKDEAMLEPATLGRINEEALDGPAPEIDAPLLAPLPDMGGSTVYPFGSLGRANDAGDDDILARIGTKGEAWADAFMSIACFNNPLGRALRQFPHGDHADLHATMLGWFANAIEAGRTAGYEAARPLDPGTIYLDQVPTREQERVAAGLSSDFTSPRAVNPVEAAIMPELRNALYDETAAIAEAAGEGMGVAGEKPE